MNIKKLWNRFRNKMECHYCPETYLKGFYSGGNVRACPKCHTNYCFGWKEGLNWLNRPLDKEYRSVGDSDKLTHIQMHFWHKNTEGYDRFAFLILNLERKTTKIVLDSRMPCVGEVNLPYLLKVHPDKINDKVKTVLLFS